MFEELRGQYFARMGALAAVSTIVLTASFIGILAFLEGAVSNFQGRIPWYLVAAALAFTATIVFLERNDVGGKVIIGTAIVVAACAFVSLTLMTEGLIYTVTNPREVFATQRVLYFLAAGLLGTGIGYWGIQHWREFTTPNAGTGGGNSL